MIVEQIEVGRLKNFNYILGCPEEKIAALIDPAWEEEKLFSFLRKRELKLAAIFLTHTHFDHIEALDRVLARAPKAKIFVHEKEAGRLIAEKGLLPFSYLKGEEELTLGRLKVKALLTPGHQPGSLCYYLPESSPPLLFTGDTLFIGRCGRVDFPGGNAQEMWESLQKIKSLPQETLLFPGHNYGSIPSQSLGEEIKSNPFLQANNYPTFLSLCQKLPS